MDYDWYEVWVDDATPIPYVLLLLHLPGTGNGPVIIDPKEDNQVVFASESYEEAKLWLLEDEFTLADGRLPGV